jgi:hypothetical protein
MQAQVQARVLAQLQDLQRLMVAALDMSEKELRAALKAEAPALRFAATYAVGERRLPWHKELIALLTDSSLAVRQAARRGLIILSFLALNPDEATLIASLRPSLPATPLEQLKPPVDFGPAPTAGRAAQARAAQQWTDWWDQREQAAAEPAQPSPGESAPAAAEDRRVAALVQAGPGRQSELLREYREAKGVEYTEALAAAIPRLTGDARRSARQALAERMARMTDQTLGRYLRDDDPEIRRAAALGLAMRESTAYVPQMIELLCDPDPAVRPVAQAALRSLSGQDFGPGLTATEEEREKAVARWRAWWEKHRD